MSIPKHKQSSFIPQYLPNKAAAPTAYINKSVAKMDDWKNEGNNANPFVSVRYIQSDFECFSQWNKIEMKTFYDFVEKLSSVTWQDVLSQSGKTDKTGFGYTEMPIKRYPNTAFKKSLDPTITIFELRVTQKSRVHCFRDAFICYICWLDKDHRIST